MQLPSLSGGYHTYRYLLSAAFEKYCLWSPVVCEPRSPLNKEKLSECEQERSNNIISFYSFLLFTVAPRYNEPLIPENSLLRMNSLGFYTPCPHINCPRYKEFLPKPRYNERKKSEFLDFVIAGCDCISPVFSLSFFSYQTSRFDTVLLILNYEGENC